jgi:hypothetical protein
MLLGDQITEFLGGTQPGPFLHRRLASCRAGNHRGEALLWLRMSGSRRYEWGGLKSLGRGSEDIGFGSVDEHGIMSGEWLVAPSLVFGLIHGEDDESLQVLEMRGQRLCLLA